ncbi:hypothetical protein HG263_16135 [Pseudoalteromonas sp. JBTF-M23]|uniref:Uncharacterized protein n=1 Tax=Pseudoalteromonas caenipelagi TaxID=2726988 RepID=A0A849VF87_9GAMM|nr:hypothetical protein [Pseudoalteromonas caenipelagi]NOU52062.1 hypothetical protein [Pseudoalteromonas caenipelagi]
MENNFTTWLDKQREELLWDLLFSSVLEVLAIFAVMLLITPYFETLNPFWYGFFLILIPLYIFSEAASALAKLKTATQKQLNDFSHIDISAVSETPITQQWQCVTIKTAILTLLPAVGGAALYYFSAKSVGVMLVIALCVGLAVFVVSALLFERYAKSLVAGTLRQARSAQPLNESQTVDLLITFHLLPWLVFAVLAFGLLMSKYYMGYVADSGQISLSSLATYSYISCTFVGFWSCYNVLEPIQTDMKLQPLFLSDTDKFSYSELFGMILGAGFIPWFALFVLGFFVPSLTSGIWLTVIAVSIIIFAVAVGVSAAALFAYSQSQQQGQGESCAP